MGRLIRHRGVQIESTKNHEIQPNFQGALQLRIAQPAPLADQQAFEQNQRIIALRSDPRSLQTTLQDQQKRLPIHQPVDLAQHIVSANPIRCFA